jgi:hypothetical protein
MQRFQMEFGNLTLKRNAREILVLHILNSIEEQNDLLNNPSMFLTKFHELSVSFVEFNNLKFCLESVTGVSQDLEVEVGEDYSIQVSGFHWTNQPLA